MGLKAGLNQTDINRTKRMLAQGYTVEECAQACVVLPDVMRRYVESLEPKAAVKKKASKKKAAETEDGNAD
jgi:hypothetical protein